MLRIAFNLDTVYTRRTSGQNARTVNKVSLPELGGGGQWPSRATQCAFVAVSVQPEALGTPTRRKL